MLSLAVAWGHGAAAALSLLAVCILALCIPLSLCLLQWVFNRRNSGKLFQQSNRRRWRLASISHLAVSKQVDNYVKDYLLSAWNCVIFQLSLWQKRKDCFYLLSSTFTLLSVCGKRHCRACSWTRLGGVGDPRRTLGASNCCEATCRQCHSMKSSTPKAAQTCAFTEREVWPCHPLPALEVFLLNCLLSAFLFLNHCCNCS